MKPLAFVMLVAGCGAAGGHSEDTLGDVVRVFNDDVRWSKFDTAAVFIPTTQRERFLDDWDERAKDLKITEYDIVKVTRKSEAEAKVQIKLEWYKDSEGKVHETSEMQTWERRKKQWMLVDEARVRGDEMPGLAEPLQKDEPVDGSNRSGEGSGRSRQGSDRSLEATSQSQKD
jgi:hypothetical protein